MALAVGTVYWGSWEYSGGNGMRVGIEIDARTTVTNGSASCTWTLKIHTQNQYTYGDSQTLSYGGVIDGQANQGFTNNQGGGDTVRDTFNHTYTYPSTNYGSSPGTRTFSASLSGAYNGVTPSKSITDDIPARPYAAANAPSSVTQSRVTDTANKISWVSNASYGRPSTAHFIQRSVDGGAFATISTTVAGSATSYTDSTAAVGHKYIYKVAADNSVGTSSYVQAPASVLTPPPAPTITNRAQVALGQQKIDWTTTVPVNYSYLTQVYASQDGGEYVLIADNIASGVLTYTHTTASSTSTWTYQVRHKTNEGVQGTLYGAFSAPSTTSSLGSTSVPLAPDSLDPSGGVSQVLGSVIRLSWIHKPTDNSAQQGYQIQWRVNGGGWTQIGPTLSANQYYDVPANTFGAGTLEFQVKTKGADATYGPFSTSASFITVGDANTASARKRVMLTDQDSGRQEFAPAGSLNPTGAVSMYAGTNIPTGWLLCQGQAISRSSFANLFSIIGTTYGAGDGSTTFNLPKIEGRFPVGRSTTDASMDTLGETGGALTHVHDLDTGSSGARVRLAGDNNLQAAAKTMPSRTQTRQGTLAGNAVVSAPSTVGVSLEGDSAAADSRPPYIVLNFIIKY